MEEFLKENYRTLTFSVEFLAVVFGLFLFDKYKFTTAKYFIYFLFYAFIVDSLGNYPFLLKKYDFFNNINGLISSTPFIKNKWWYTIFWRIGSVIFYVFYYYHILNNKNHRKFIKYLGICFVIFSIIILFVNSRVFFISSFPSITLFGVLIVFLCTTFFFIEILISEKILNFYKSINFYISSAILLWWLIVTPLIFFDIYHNKSDWDFVFLKWHIFLFANFFMYTTFTIGLIVSKPEK